MSKIVLILDYGSQYTQLIARRVRELQVYCEILPFDTNPEALLERKPAAIILSGGPASVTSEDAPPLSRTLLESDAPILGICYGLQVLTRTLGGEVRPSNQREYGRASIQLETNSGLFAGLESQELTVWMSHGDHVAQPAEGFEVTARSADGVIAAIANEPRNIYGVQFHPEVVHTPQGKEIIRNFVYDIAAYPGIGHHPLS